MEDFTSTNAIILAPRTNEDRARELLFTDTTNIARRAFGIGNAFIYTGLTLAPFAAKIFDVLPGYPVGLIAVASIAAGAAGGIARNSSLGTAAKILEASNRYWANREAGMPEQELERTAEEDLSTITPKPLRKINYDFGMYAAPRNSDLSGKIAGPILAGMNVGLKENGAIRVARASIRVATKIGIWAIAGGEYALEMVQARKTNAPLNSFGELRGKWGSSADTLLRKLHIKGRSSIFREDVAVTNIASRIKPTRFASAPGG